MFHSLMDIIVGWIWFILLLKKKKTESLEQVAFVVEILGCSWVFEDFGYN